VALRELLFESAGGSVVATHQELFIDRVIGSRALHGERVIDADLAMPVGQKVLGDAAGDAGSIARGEICHRCRLGNQPGGFDAHQVGVARTDADAEQPPRHAAGSAHSRAHARAFTAAAAMALPPRRPVTVTKGILAE
jgi:hypothetical protein